MAATVDIYEMTTDESTGVSKTDSTVRFKAVASSVSTAVDNDNPLVVPTGADIYSYVKRLRPFLTVAPATNITDLRWYTDGIDPFGAGVSVKAKATDNTWVAPVDTEMADGVNIFTYTEGAPLDGDATDEGPFLPGSAGSHIGDMIELQMTVANTATNGQTASPSLTLAYSEI